MVRSKLTQCRLFRKQLALNLARKRDEKGTRVAVVDLFGIEKGIMWS